MKVLALVILVSLCACSTASISDYNQGCRDGIRILHPFESYQKIINHCDSVEERHEVEIHVAPYPFAGDRHAR